MSVSYQKDGKIEISVHRIGDGTAAMHRMKKGELMGLRGPFGSSFDIKKNVLLVGGGCGAAPMIFLAEKAKEQGAKVTGLVGACTKGDVLFEKRFKACGEFECSTDDGTYGYNGFVTELLEEKLEENKYDCVYTCGPELMMKGVFKICEENNVELQASLERYMKCGVGICGSCAINGYRVCKDGPVFRSEQLRNMSEFGTLKRNGSGKGVKI